MILIEQKWDDSLFIIDYGDGYDIRLHAVQVALNLIDRRSPITGAKMRDINFSSVKFGYHDVETENAIREFQLALGIPSSARLDKVTYELLFLTLREELNVVIIETKSKELKLCDITDEIADALPEYDYDLDLDVDSNIDNELNDSSNSGNTVYPGMGNNLGDLGYGDLQIGINQDWSPSFNDSFLNSLVGEYDDFYAIFSQNRPFFGNGGSSWNGRYNTDGSSSESFDGSFNLGDFNGNYSDIHYSGSNGDGVTFVDGLLANSIYQGNFEYDRPTSWVSNSKMNINVDGYNYEGSEKYKTFFDSKNTSDTRKSNYDITIVYGPNGRFAKKIIGIRPRGKSQQVDASGEAIFDVLDFIAKDIVETDNRRRG